MVGVKVVMLAWLDWSKVDAWVGVMVGVMVVEMAE